MSETQQEERELVRRCREGRETAYHEFVERFQSLIFGVCARLLTDRHEAEDVAQEVFVRAIRNLHKWDVERPLKPWLMTITVNRCKTFLSRRKTRPIAVESLEDLADLRVAEESANELRTEIRTAVNQLRGEYRQAFLLYHEQGLSYQEISESLEKPIGTLKTWLHRARAEILAYLRQKGFVPECRHDLSEV